MSTREPDRFDLAVLEEEARQDAKWGQQDHPDGTGRTSRVLEGLAVGSLTADAWSLSEAARLRTDTLATGLGRQLTWSDILLEEVFEALAEDEPEKLQKELNQIAAVAVQWARAIQRRVDAVRRVTPDVIEELAEGEVFVFGSNVHGYHGAGAARTAMESFGAVWGVGEGPQGRSYAIPTMEGLPALVEAVERFLAYAAGHQELRFLVTKVGTGIAGHQVEEVAPAFRGRTPNVIIPAEFERALAG